MRPRLGAKQTPSQFGQHFPPRAHGAHESCMIIHRPKLILVFIVIVIMIAVLPRVLVLIIAADRQLIGSVRPGGERERDREADSLGPRRSITRTMRQPATSRCARSEDHRSEGVREGGRGREMIDWNWMGAVRSTDEKKKPPPLRRFYNWDSMRDPRVSECCVVSERPLI